MEFLQFKGTWRTFQQRVLNYFDLYSQDKKFHIVASPGSGKTILGIELIRKVGQSCLVLVPTTTIRQQWVSRIQSMFLNEGVEASEVLSEDLKNPKTITIATYQALHQMMSAAEETETSESKKKEIREAGEAKLRQLQLGCICLDECHHLRNEWWKSLEQFKKDFPDLFTIALTATPPYDSGLYEWTRYLEMCGQIDEEITSVELVKADILCPHQDYVYFSMPTQAEQKRLRKFTEEVSHLMNYVRQDRAFLSSIQNHGLFHEATTVEQLLEQDTLLITMLTYLNSVGVTIPRRYLKLLGIRKLDSFDVAGLQILLQAYLFDEPQHFADSEQVRDFLLQQMKRKGMIERRQVQLLLNESCKRELVHSLSKLTSIEEIVAHEANCLKEELRLLILTDYIRKEIEAKLGDPSFELQELGVLPIFEQCRRGCQRRNLPLKLGVCCGSLMILPQSASSAFQSLCPDVELKAVGQCHDYVQVSVIGELSVLVQAMTTLFEQGEIQVLISTKSLLGEGWDSPCINSLILASTVGTYMTANQMRGRAIRRDPAHPDKVSNIWHLVCVQENEGQTQSIDVQHVCQRMEHFLGLHYSKKRIESGMDRFEFPPFPINRQILNQMNERTFNLSGQRSILKQRWKEALAIYPKMEIAQPIAVRNDVTKVALTSKRMVASLVGAGCFVSGVLLQPVAFFPFSVLFYIVSVATFVTGFTGMKFYRQKERLSQIAQGILMALQESGQLQSEAAELLVEQEEEKMTISLVNATSHDKVLFAKCLQQFLAPIQNQRYLLVSRQFAFVFQACFAVSESFSATKAEAMLFQRCLKKVLSGYKIVYTRSEKGRKILLKARKATRNRQGQTVGLGQRIKGVG